MKGNKIGRSIKFLQSDIFPFVTLSQKSKTILLLNFQPRISYENKILNDITYSFCKLVSISPTFYEQLLHQNPFAKKLQTQILST
jgi:hypothetical protein